MIFSIGDIHQGTRYRIKDREKAIIFQEICTGTGVTRKTISKKLQIRPTTVSYLVQELIDQNLVTEGNRKQIERPGRPELYLLPNNNSLTAISLYVEGRKLKGQLVNLKEEIIFQDEMTIGEDAGNREFSNALISFLQQLKSQKPPDTLLLGAGISLVGTVNSRKNLWISCARWNRIKNLDFYEIEKQINIPIIIRRALDTELEYKIVKNREFRNKNILLFHWGFGIGTSFSYRGTVLSSTIGRFGEIGHSRIFENDSKPCRCGLKGCLETEAALWAIASELKKESINVNDDEREFIRTLQEENNIINTDTMINALKHVSAAITILHKIFYPDEILLIGPFTENKTILEKLQDSIYTNIPQYARSSLKISVIYGGFTGSIYGSIYGMFFNKLRELLTAKS